MLLNKCDSQPFPICDPSSPIHTCIYIHVLVSQSWEVCLSIVSKMYFQATVIHFAVLEPFLLILTQILAIENYHVITDIWLAAISRRLYDDMFYSREVEVGEIYVLESVKFGFWCAKVGVNEIRWDRQTIHFIISTEFESFEF